MCELTEVMRQQGNHFFIDILNNARVGDPSDRDTEISNSRKEDIEDVSGDPSFEERCTSNGATKY